MIENLTKENFWNEMQEKYPKAMKKFCDWIDEYKKENQWITLFGAMGDMEGTAPKYHDLPIAFQIGIFIEFCAGQDIILGTNSCQELVNFTRDYISDALDLINQFDE